MAVSRNLLQSKFQNVHFAIRTPHQVYMQNLSQIGEPACPQIFDLAPFLRTTVLKRLRSPFTKSQRPVFKTIVLGNHSNMTKNNL